jgi:hypothetical protein
MEGEMPAPKGNQYARGNKGGRPTKYKPEFAEIAEKLCAKCAFTDAQLADWFEVSVRTINEWKLRHLEFAEALKTGKAETDDLVERGTVAGIIGYYVLVDEMDRFGNVRQLRKWISGNPHAGMKWLVARRPEQYRERKEDQRILSMDDAFLKFLEQIDEEQKREKALNAQRQVIELNVIEAEAVEVKRDDGAARVAEGENAGDLESGSNSASGR